MSVGVRIKENSGIFYFTFTCLEWKPVLQLADAYDLVYKWFDYLTENGHFITAYVIMPNHIHGIIALKNSSKPVTTVISNAKRFLAYGIVEKLKEKKADEMLNHMYHAVTKSDRKRGKIHQVFNASFDCKECYTEYFTHQKLMYIHNNPCQGKWNLSSVPELYQHSSARFYSTGEQGVYPVTHLQTLMDIAL